MWWQNALQLYEAIWMFKQHILSYYVLYVHIMCCRQRHKKEMLEVKQMIWLSNCYSIQIDWFSLQVLHWFPKLPPNIQCHCLCKSNKHTRKIVWYYTPSSGTPFQVIHKHISWDKGLLTDGNYVQLKSFSHIVNNCISSSVPRECPYTVLNGF